MSSLEEDVRAGLAGRYELERELGRGGMAVVYLATDRKHDRRVAIKVMSPDLVTATGADRFAREIRAVARLSHPHLLPVLDSGELAGPEPRAWYAMPYVEGGSLRDRLRSGGALPVADAVRIVAEAAEALDYAHRQGLVHRDVKPANVLLQDGQAVVADFGVAGALAGDPEQRLTESGMVMGTVRYMSPEQATGSASVDRRSDVYSLGCVLYEALTGRAPFADAGSPAAVLARVVTEDPEPVSRARPAAAALDAVVARALARVPADRFATAGELAQALRASTPGQGVAAVAAPASSAAGESPARSRLMNRGVLVAAGAVVVIGAVVGLTALRDTDAPAATAGTGPFSLAVLALESLGSGAGDDLAAGIHAELHTRLTRIEGIRLVGRQSVRRLEESGAELEEIADELGVTHFLGGSVQRRGDEAILRVELSDAAGTEQLWGDSYEMELTDFFDVQTQVAVRVADALRGVLAPAERTALAELGTDDPEALAQYVLGEASWQRFYDEEDVGAANAAFERAVALDGEFAAAWSKLVQTRLQLQWLWGEWQERERARDALDRLEALAPGSPEYRMAEAVWLYWGEERNEEALTALEAVGEQWPNDVYVMAFTGAVQRRLGRWDEGIATMERALGLDPGNGFLASNLGQWHTILNDWQNAERYARLAVTLEPTVEVEWWHWAYVHMLQGDWERAREVVDSAGALLVDERLQGGGWWAGWQVLTGGLDGVLDLYADLYRTDPRTYDGTWSRWWDLGLAGLAERGDEETVRAYAGTLRDGADAVRGEVPEGNARLRSQILQPLAVAEAYLGNDEAALAWVEAGGLGPLHVATIHVRAGRYDEAVEVLHGVLSSLGEYTVALMRRDPRWAPLRDHGGYRTLLADPPRRTPGA